LCGFSNGRYYVGRFVRALKGDRLILVGKKEKGRRNVDRIISGVDRMQEHV